MDDLLRQVSETLKNAGSQVRRDLIRKLIETLRVALADPLRRAEIASQHGMAPQQAQAVLNAVIGELLEKLGKL